MEGLPFIIKILVLSLLVLPLSASLCDLSYTETTFKASLYLIPLWQMTPVFNPWMMDGEKRENKRERENFPGFIFCPLLSSGSHTDTRKQGGMSERDGDVFCSVVVLLPSLSVPPSFFLSLCLSLSLFPRLGGCLRGRLCCAVVMGEMALRVWRHL